MIFQPAGTGLVRYITGMQQIIMLQQKWLATKVKMFVLPAGMLRI
jgi:hypothetical protein